MAGTYRTDNIGRYMSDMNVKVKSNEYKALSEINPDFAQMLAEMEIVKDPSFKTKPAPLANFVPRLVREGNFATILKRFEKTRSETAHRALIDNVGFRINKVFMKHHDSAAGQSFKTMAGNRNKMIEACLPLVYAVAKHYLARAKNERVTIDDLIQAGNLGLVIASDKYVSTPVEGDSRPRAKFSAYAYFWIRKYVMEESFRQATMLSGTSRDVEHAARNTYNVSSDPWSESGEDSNREKASPWDKLNAKEASMISEHERDLKEIQMATKELFKNLKDTEKRVLFLVYGIDTPTGQPYTFEEAGKLIGKSKTTVSRMMESIFFKIQLNLKKSANAKDVIATLSLLQGVDLSKAEAWTMASTY